MATSLSLLTVNSFMNNSFKKPNVGMTLIEVLVALVILVTGILGAVVMQASAKKGSFDAMQRSVASALAQDIIERMRSNSADLVTLESYEGTYGAAANSVPSTRCNSSAAVCTPAQIVTNDLYEWELNLLGADVKYGTANNGGLVGARACITHSNFEVDVVISWQSQEKTSDGASDSSTFAKSCGTSSDKRRQIEVNTFIY